MKYAVVYSSKTGNTKRLADEIRQTLPAEECIYAGMPDVKALSADRLYIGFWTDKGTCDHETEIFLKKIHGKEIVLFGTSGYSGEDGYYDIILKSVIKKIDSSNTVVDTYMCQGRMPMSVRERYQKMQKAPIHPKNLDELILNFDKALSHPDEEDLINLRKVILFDSQEV